MFGTVFFGRALVSVYRSFYDIKDDEPFGCRKMLGGDTPSVVGIVSANLVSLDLGPPFAQRRMGQVLLDLLQDVHVVEAHGENSAASSR